MNTSIAALAAAALVGGALAVAPTAAHAAACSDPEHPIDRTVSSDVVVGTTHTKTMKLTLTTREGCRVTGASATVHSPSSTTKVTLLQTHTADGYVFWEGSLRIVPKNLRNSDAGAWKITYAATGDDAQTVSDEASVRRATRLSFNAGPEPAKKRLTYAGTLERANWNKHHYYGYREQITITYEAFNPDGPSQSPELVTELTTTTSGEYRYTEAYRGPGDYNADFAGNRTSADRRSPFDHVGH